MNIPLNVKVRDFDELQLFFGQDYIVNQHIKIKQPTVREIVEFGEREQFNFIQTICSIPSDMKSALWDAGIDYEQIDDFDLFIMLTRGLSEECSKFIFYDLDLSKFDICLDTESQEVVLANEDRTIIIDKLLYRVIIDYVRTVHGIVPKVEKSFNELTKRKLIDLDRQQKLSSANKKYTSVLLPLIVSLVCTEECKYTSKTIQDIGIYELFESIKQVQKKKNACALLQGSYSGMIDTSKINKDAFNWMKAV